MTAPGVARILLVSALGFEKADAQRFAIRVRFGELENAVFVGLAGSLDRTKLTRDASEYSQSEWENDERGPGADDRARMRRDASWVRLLGLK
jgi:hypothetical protein